MCDIGHTWDVWLSRVAGMDNDNITKVTFNDQSCPYLWIYSEVRHTHTIKHTSWCRAEGSNKSCDWLRIG